MLTELILAYNYLTYKHTIIPFLSLSERIQSSDMFIKSSSISTVTRRTL